MQSRRTTTTRSHGALQQHLSLASLVKAIDSTLARISLPIDINSEAPASHTADLIGGQGSLCPALLPNTSLRQMRSAVFSEWYQNGDGVLVCSPNGQRLDHPDANLVIMRILLTETSTSRATLPSVMRTRATSRRCSRETLSLLSNDNTGADWKQHPWHQ